MYSAVVTVKRNLISSIQISCNLALQELIKFVKLKIPFLPNTTLHNTKLHTAKVPLILILSLQCACTILCVPPRMGCLGSLLLVALTSLASKFPCYLLCYCRGCELSLNDERVPFHMCHALVCSEPGWYEREIGCGWVAPCITEMGRNSCHRKCIY